MRSSSIILLLPLLVSSCVTGWFAGVFHEETDVERGGATYLDGNGIFIGVTGTFTRPDDVSQTIREESAKTRETYMSTRVATPKPAKPKPKDTSNPELISAIVVLVTAVSGWIASKSERVKKLVQKGKEK